MAGENFDIKIGMSAKGFNDSVKEVKEQLSHLEKMVDYSSKAIDQQGKTLDSVGSKLKAQSKLYSEMEKTVESYEKGIKDANTEIDKLNITLNEQQNELDQLKAKYTEVAKEQGEGSKSARDLAREIKQQEKSIKKTETAIDKYTVQSNKMSRETEQTKAKMSILKSQLSSTAKEFDDLGGDVREAIGDLKDYEKILEKVAKAEEKNNKKSFGSKLKDNWKDAKEGYGDKGATKAVQVGQAVAGTGKEVASAGADKIIEASQAYDEQIGIVNRLQQTTGATREEAENLEQIARDGANTGAFAYEDMIDSIQAVKQNLAGVSDEELPKISQGLATMTAQGYDSGEMTRTMNQLMKTYGITGEQALDMIIKGQQDGIDKNGNMLDSFNEYAPMFKQLGFSANDMYGILSSGAKNGIYDVDKIGDAAKEMGLRFTGASKGMKDAFKENGISFDDYQKKIKKGGSEGAKAMSDLAKKVLSIEDATKRQALATEIFGTQYEDTGDALLKTFAEAETGINNTDGAMQKAVDTQKENASTFGAMQSQFKDMFEEIGKALEPLITLIGDVAAKFTEWLKAHPMIAQIVAGVLLIITVVGGLLAIIGTVVAVVVPILSLIGTLTAGITLPILGIIAAIAAVIAIVVLLWQNWDQVCQWCSQAWTNLCTWISEKWNGFTTWISESLSSIANWFSEKFEQCKTWAIEKLQALLQWICELPGKIWQGIVSIGQFFADCFEQAKTRATEKINNLITFVKDLPGKVWSGICSIAEKFGTAFQNAKQKASEKVSDLISDVKKIPGKVWDAICEIPSKFFNAFSRAKEEALRAIGNLRDSIVNKVSGWFDSILPISLDTDINTNENVARRVRNIGNTPLNNNLVATLSTLDTPTIANTTRDRLNSVDFSNDFYNPISQASLTIAGQAVLGGIKEVKTDSTNNKLDMLIDLLLNMMSNGLDTNVNFNDKVVVRNETDIDLIIRKIDEAKKMKDRRNGLTKINR